MDQSPVVAARSRRSFLTRVGRSVVLSGTAVASATRAGSRVFQACLAGEAMRITGEAVWNPALTPPGAQ